MLGRFSCILLAACFLAIGSGLAEYWHNVEHEREDAAQAAAERAAGRPVKENSVHDDSNCATHAQLHMPFTGGCWVPLLVFLGLFIALVSEIARPLISRPIAFNPPCRGPPLR